MDFLGPILGTIMKIIYKIVSNYGVAIILLSALIKLALLPLTVKQQKSMAGMQKIQPLINEIQSKYANDKEKQSQEMMKLYQEYKISPTAGCLPLLLQFPILIGLYAAIAKPLSFMCGLSADQIKALGELTGIATTGNPYSYEIAIAKAAGSADLIAKAQEIAEGFFAIDFNFLWLDLSVIASWGVVSLAWILPFLSAIATFLSSYLMQPHGKDAPKTDSDNPASNMTKGMLYFMPLMILYIGFSVPGGLCLYWAVNSLLQIVQYFTFDKKLKEKLSVEIDEKNAVKEQLKLEKKKKKKRKGK